MFIQLLPHRSSDQPVLPGQYHPEVALHQDREQVLLPLSGKVREQKQLLQIIPIPGAVLQLRLQRST